MKNKNICSETFRIIVIALAMTAFAPRFFSDAALGANIPLPEVYSSALPASYERDSFLKRNLARTAASIKETARVNSLDFMSLETFESDYIDGATRADYVNLQFSFLTYDILDAANFIEDMAEGYAESKIALVAFSLNRQERLDGRSVRSRGRQGRATAGIYSFTAKFRKAKDARKTDVFSPVIADVSRFIKYCGCGGFDISGATLTDFNNQLMVAGNFSLLGTKKRLVTYLDSKILAKLSGYRISEKEIGASRSTVVMPFWLCLDFIR